MSPMAREPFARAAGSGLSAQDELVRNQVKDSAMMIPRFATPVLTLAAAAALAGCETVAETTAEAVAETDHVSLTGSQEVPGPGDPDGSANAELTIVDQADQICYEINDVQNIAPATAAHIHRGAAGVSGPVVIPLDTPSDGDSKGCVNVSEALADEIKRNPSGFYFNIHNAPYPNGAIRGQIRDRD